MEIHIGLIIGLGRVDDLVRYHNGIINLELLVELERAKHRLSR